VAPEGVRVGGHVSRWDTWFHDINDTFLPEMMGRNRWRFGRIDSMVLHLCENRFDTVGLHSLKCWIMLAESIILMKCFTVQSGVCP